jgi:hypothetical protein
LSPQGFDPLINEEKDLLEALGFEKEEPEEHDQILE